MPGNTFTPHSFQQRCIYLPRTGWRCLNFYTQFFSSGSELAGYFVSTFLYVAEISFPFDNKRYFLSFLGG